ncbi:MAG: hypothetical protein SOR74_11100, partial [Candidatus Faecivicinus sp.]|nr:hypothetical protein [Candidatus Faecivicinus sp.]
MAGFNRREILADFCARFPGERGTIVPSEAKRGCEKTPQEDKKGFGARKRDKSFFVWYNLVEMKTTP